MLIAFIGPARCGKTTAADIMEGQGFSKLSFAHPLKNMLKEIGLSHRELYNDLKDSPSPTLLNKTPRHAMQSLGDWGREKIHKDFWVDAWRNLYRFHSSLSGDVVVDDARYINELECIRDLGGIVVRLVRQDDGTVSQIHSSEREWRKWEPDFYIANHGDRNDLRKALCQVFGDRLQFQTEDYGC